MNGQINDNNNHNYYNINNNNNININDNNLNNNRRNKLVLSIIIVFAIIISLFNIYSFINIVNFIKKYYLILPQKVFEECFLFPKFYDLFIQFISLFLGIDLISLIIIPCIDYFSDLDAFLSKFGESFFYYNYLIFGPFLLGSLILSLKYHDKLMYSCINYNPEKKTINFNFFFVFIFSISLSGIITFLGSIYNEDKYFSDSIKYKTNGNFLIGNIFWKYALSRSHRFANRLNRNNLIVEIIDNTENNQNEN